jgi:FdhD protein
MADSAAKTQSTKRIDKVIYTRISNNRELKHDSVITEQPLQIILHWYNTDNELVSKVYAITMRTLGNEKYLIFGLLFSEGVISSLSDIESICPENVEDNADEPIINNSWLVHLNRSKQPELTSIERFQSTYSSCGLCGATSLKALELKNPPNLLALTEKLQFNSELVYTLSDKMRLQQKLFSLTGGVHGAALFDQQAHLLAVFEDIGRHNAVDKLIGHRIVEQQLLQSKQLLVMLVSGRVSFEIVQKAVMAGISILVAVGSPSDLAIKAAQRFELTLIGFACANSFNVYCGDWRIDAIHQVIESN